MRAAWLFFLLTLLSAQPYDLVIRNGRVVDPESGLDGVRQLGISAGKIQAVSADPLEGRAIVDALALWLRLASSIFIRTARMRKTTATKPWTASPPRSKWR